jgi:hypothetical protein
MKPAAHGPLQDITLFVSNMKASYMLYMLNLITDTAACLQP